jgi:hypothetical protein
MSATSDVVIVDPSTESNTLRTSIERHVRHISLVIITLSGGSVLVTTHIGAYRK